MKTPVRSDSSSAILFKMLFTLILMTEVRFAGAVPLPGSPEEIGVAVSSVPPPPASPVPPTTSLPPVPPSSEPEPCERPCVSTLHGCSCPNPEPPVAISPETSDPLFTLIDYYIDYYGNGGLPGVAPHYLQWNPNSTPTCLGRIIQRATNTCAGFGVDVDDCVATMIIGRLPFGPNRTDLPAGSPIVATETNSEVHSDYVSLRVRTVVDSNCNIMPVGTEYANRVDLRVLSSPISFLWDEGVDVDRDVVLSRFRLDLTSSDQWVVWKASERAPLLVFDPEKRRHVSSAAQLFGNWTFGGPSFASLAGTTSPVPWKNGYEPLALMDKDSNGRIEGDELVPLALWFDRDRDASSQSGEIIGVQEAGVTAIFYEPDTVNSRTKAIRASRGFERRLHGRRIVGASVDRFAASAASQWSLVQHLQQASIASLNQSMLSRTSKLFVDATAPWWSPRRGSATEAREYGAPLSRKSTARRLSGVWRWKTDESVSSADFEPQGLFVFSERYGQIRGASLVETYLPEKQLHLVDFVPLSGRAYTDRSGLRHAQFRFTDAPDDSATRSTARLLNDAHLLKGLTLETGLEYQEQRISVRYSWSAERLTLSR